MQLQRQTILSLSFWRFISQKSLDSLSLSLAFIPDSNRCQRQAAWETAVLFIPFFFKNIYGRCAPSKDMEYIYGYVEKATLKTSRLTVVGATDTRTNTWYARPKSYKKACCSFLIQSVASQGLINAELCVLAIPSRSENRRFSCDLPNATC